MLIQGVNRSIAVLGSPGAKACARSLPKRASVSLPFRRGRELRVLLVAALCMSTVLPQSISAQRRSGGSSADVILNWRVKSAWSVGGAMDTSLVIATLKVKDIATHAGTLLIVDRDRSQIARYSSDGARLTPVGRGQGAGPGELRFPRSVAVDPGGRTIVEDLGNARISYFDARGRFLKSRPHTSQRSIWQLRAVTDSSLIGLATSSDSTALAVLTDHGLRSLVSMRAPRWLGTAPVCSTTGYGFNPLFSPTILFATSGAFLAFTTGDGRISIFRGDRPLAKHTHAFPVRRTSTAMARAHLGEGIRIQVQGMRPCTVPAALILDAGEIAPTLPAYSSLAVEPDGAVWATRFAVGNEPALADVFHPERGYVGTVNVGTARPIAFLSSSLMVSLENDEDEVPVVRVYQVTR